MKIDAPDRRLIFNRKHVSGIKKNSEFKFAAEHALHFHKQNAIYTYIPKNACSTIKYSLALNNGLIDETVDPHWVNENLPMLKAGISTLHSCDYSFVVLRCPYRRLVSAYFDKVVSGRNRGRKVFKGTISRMLLFLGNYEHIRTLSFSEFVRRNADIEDSNMDVHWRPQVTFLVFKEYDDWFSLEKFKEAKNALGDRGIRIVDTRSKLQHDASHFKVAKGYFGDNTAQELLKMKNNGSLPNAESMYDDKSIEFVQKRYAEDIELYRRKVGPSGLLVV